jgi:archaellum component FlaF (FlaF/FlaG flagellin family)
MLLNCFIASSTLYKSMQKLPQNRAKHICKGKDDVVFRLSMETTEITNFLRKLPMEMIASMLLCVNIFFVKALRQWRQIREAMKWWNVNFGKKLKQWSDEALNASSHHFIANVAQLWLYRYNVHKHYHAGTVVKNWDMWCDKNPNTQLWGNILTLKDHVVYWLFFMSTVCTGQHRETIGYHSYLTPLQPKFEEIGSVYPGSQQ